jgi:hypothetical protein
MPCQSFWAPWTYCSNPLNHKWILFTRLTPPRRAHIKVVDQYLQFLFIGPQRRANCEPVL